MVSRVRASIGKVAFVMVAALGAVGCETGGLLVVENKEQPTPTVQGPSVNEMVNGGNYATNGKYRIFYTFGQPTPNQGIGTSSESQLNGGLVGAAHGD